MKYMPVDLFQPGDVIMERYVLIRPVRSGESCKLPDGEMLRLNNWSGNKWWAHREGQRERLIVVVDMILPKNVVRK